MPVTLEDFCITLADRLRVDDSYLTTDLPASVRRLVKKLLRDYHFPKSIRKSIWSDVPADTQSYTLPSDFKKPLLLCFMDRTDADAPAFSEPLARREGFVRARTDGAPAYYWLEGVNLWTDISVPDNSPNTDLILVYESNDVEYNLGWLLDDYEDVVFSYCMSRLSAELNKTELLQTWTALWGDDRVSLAIYQNELEFEGMEIMQRPATMRDSKGRYPAERDA